MGEAPLHGNPRFGLLIAMFEEVSPARTGQGRTPWGPPLHT